MQDSQTILFVINTLDEGGAAKMLKNVASIAVDVFSEVKVFSLYHSNTNQLDLDKKVEVINANLLCGGIKGRIVGAKKVRNYIKAYRPSVLCSFISDVCFTSRLAALGIRNVKVVSAERGDPYALGFPWGLITKWVYRTSDYCFFQLEKARDFFGSSVARKSFVIPNAFSDKNVKEPYYGERKKTIVSVGRFYEVQKRFCLLIEAFKIVHERHQDYSLIIYGDGSDRSQIQAKVDSLGLNECVSLPGSISNPVNVIREDGIFVLSSDFEGIPNSLIEALSTGIPCVTTDCSPGGAAFLTKNGKNALMVPINDANEMANAICKIIECPDLAAELSLKGPEILEELKEDKIRGMWINAFKQIITSR